MNIISSNLGSNFGLDYLKYQATKEGGESFVDFLLEYDTVKNESGDEGLLGSLFQTDNLLGILSPKAINALDANSSLNIFGSKSKNESSFLMVDEQTTALK